MREPGEGGSQRPHRPRKRFGQHFLADSRTLARIVEALDPAPDDTVLEIGPGRGALTDLLVSRLSDGPGKLVAVEVDRDLVAVLTTRYAGRAWVRIVEGDAMELDWGELAGGERFLLVGNLPYYITTPLIFRALAAPRPARIVVLVQREVAERMVSPPGSKTYGALSVNLQALAEAEIVGKVPAGAFHPPPKVDSAIVRITPRSEPLVSAAEERRFQSFVQGLFGFRRKQLMRALRELAGIDAARAAEVIAGCALDPGARPETLQPRDFVALFRALG